MSFYCKHFPYLQEKIEVFVEIMNWELVNIETIIRFVSFLLLISSCDNYNKFVMFNFFNNFLNNELQNKIIVVWLISNDQKLNNFITIWLTII